MASGTITAEPAAEAPVQTVQLPPQFTPTMAEPMVVALAGCGGIGARVAPMLIKLMRAGDTLVLIDHDQVEDKNLKRQHFSPKQVGMHKAEAVAASIAVEAERLEVNLIPKVEMVTGGTLLNGSASCHHGIMVLSGFDNREARIATHHCIQQRYGSRAVWIDAGNERRSGQVMLSLYNWRMNRVVANGQPLGATSITAHTLKQALPDMLNPRGATAPVEDQAIDCALGRIDDQTLAANALAATYMITMFSWFRYEIPFTTLGVFFSTLGSTRTVNAGVHTPGTWGDRGTFNFGIA